jgi:hypothetical protein
VIAEVLTRARVYVALGFSVIPIPCPRPGVPEGHPGDGKTPAIPWRPFQDRPATDEVLVAWFAGKASNLAIITGAVSGLVVVDVDDPHAAPWGARHLPYTPWQTRTARGYHLFYGHPGIPVRNRARLDTGNGRLAIDVRGDGGYVIAPGSVHASGAVYREAGDWTATRGEVPVFRLDWIAAPPRPHVPRGPLPRPGGDLAERARRYLAAIPRPEIGAGSDAAVFEVACRLVRGFELAPAAVEALLWEWAGGRPGWTRAWVAAKVEHAERYGSEPVGGLR